MMMSTPGSRIGFFQRIGRGWKMTKLGMAVVRADPELMVYTLLSAVFSMVAAVAVISGSIGLEAVTDSEAATAQEEDLVTAAHLGMAFVGYLVISVITVFWNAAIIASAYERLTAGTNPSFSYGIKQATKCLPQILVWGVISGTVGMLLKVLEGVARDGDSPNPLRIVAGLATFVIGVAWWMATFFIVPILVLERAGVLDGMKESPKLFKETWGEDVGSHMGTGILQGIVILLFVLIALPLMFLGEAGGVLAVVIVLLGIGLSVLFFTTVESVNRASLFYYAKTGEIPPMAQKVGIEF
ncbi:MAG: hypothetical protein CMB35_00550 [Euryarchaeota archaeon]|nr:hypothetical protein [Euryarchaeota archaeon]